MPHHSPSLFLLLAASTGGSVHGSVAASAVVGSSTEVAALKDVALSGNIYARHPTDKYLRKLVRQATDGCVNVFVDAGANIGVHTRFLFEPAAYPQSSFTKVFSDVFGAAPNHKSAMCSLGFEPNPKHIDRHMALQSAYRHMGWRYSFFPYALGVNTSGELVFYENGGANGGEQNEYWGFGTTQRHNNQREVRVPSVSLDTVLEQIGRRRLPRASRAGHTMHPRVLVKMDIEGSEFAVIPQVMMTGRLCQVVDYLSVEWHPRPNPVRFYAKQQLNLPTYAEAATIVRVLKAAMADGGYAGGCLTNVVEVDDETYVHDGRPLPGFPEGNTVPAF